MTDPTLHITAELDRYTRNLELIAIQIRSRPEPPAAREAARLGAALHDLDGALAQLQALLRQT